jgi:tRNA (guanine37-N1)-methyltransferase
LEAAGRLLQPARVRIDILSLFPAIAAGALAESILGKAQQRQLIEVHHHDLRDWATDKHRTCDDTPYGGGQGMVMKCEPIFAAVEDILGRVHGQPGPISRDHPAAGASRIILLSPGGRLFHQQLAQAYARQPHLLLICGHYEGVDHRVAEHLVHEELSIGDYVLTNGAIAAVVVVDAVARLLPGVLGDAQSAADDSHASGLLEFPHYTRPASFRGWGIPEILLSGHHGEIARWRRERALEKTRRVRPDLLPPQP